MLFNEDGMHPKTLKYAASALLVMFAMPALAASYSVAPSQPRLPVAQPLVQLAQMGDPRVTQLEDQLRQLNGLVEELNFQILQMQEQLRKMQEDNEFRFQELEGQRQGNAGSPRGERQTAQEQVAPTQQQGAVAQLPDGQNGSAAQRGEPPRTFGQITFDSQGNVIGAQPGDPVPSVGTQQGGLPGVETGPARTDQTTVAALPGSNDPETLYRDSYQSILSGDYANAEQGFRQFVENHPNSGNAADAQFWLGEALLGQGKNREAAQVFLSASREHPEAPKAPDAMLKLGISLAGMNQRDVACATFAEVPRRYPQASSQILERARDEHKRASC